MVVDGGHGADKLGLRVFVGVAVIQPVDIRQQDQQLCPDGGRHNSGQGVILPDGVLYADLVGGHGVVLVDDRQRPQLQQPEDGVAHVAAAVFIFHVLAGQQHLRHRVAVFVEQLVVGIHQFALAYGGGRLLGGHILGTPR